MGILTAAADTEERVPRRMYMGGDKDDPAHHSESEGAGVNANIRIIDLVLRLVFLVLTTVVELVILACYWKCYIKPTADKFIPVRAIPPEDMRGKWMHDVCDWGGDIGTCCCFIWCHPCALADLWYRAGWLHAVFKDLDGPSCPGWLFCAGVLGYVFAQHVASCCMPCGYAALRGGVSWIDNSDGGLGDIKPLRKLFGLPHDGFSTFCQDCCLWCWCPCLAGTQEYRQVMSLLDRGTVRVEAAPETIVVGQPVQVVGHPVETPGESNASKG